MPDAWPEGIAALWLLGMVRPSVQEEAWLRADHNWNTCVCWMKLFMVGLATTAAVQLEKPLQKDELAPPSAASKNGCTGTVLLPTQSGLSPHMGRYVPAKACAKLCPFSVIMVGTASRSRCIHS